MKCRQCAAEIADKAIVCYRCGTPTADLPEVPRHGPAKSGGNRVLLILLVVIGLVAVIVALFVLGGGQPALAPQVPQAHAYPTL